MYYIRTMPNIQKQLKRLPKSSGVYFFRDGKKNILYIGKATNLKRRVSSYFSKGFKNSRLQDLMKRTVKISYQRTGTPTEALILEALLIRYHQPSHNILSKDDSFFTNIIISQEEFPRVFTRKYITDELCKEIKIYKIFGPYPYSGTVRAALDTLRRFFPFRGMERTKEEERFYRELTGVSEDKEEYRKAIKKLVLFLEGKRKRLVGSLNRRMKVAAKCKKYEEAAKLRDAMRALKYIQYAATIKI